MSKKGKTQKQMSKGKKLAEEMSREYEELEKKNKKYFDDNKEAILKYFEEPRVFDIDIDKQRKSPAGFALMSEDDIKHFKKYTTDNIQEKFSPIEFQKHLDMHGKNINVDEMMQQELTRSLKPLNKKYLKTLSGGKRKTRKRKKRRRGGRKKKKTRRRKRGKKRGKKTRKNKKHHHTVTFKADKCSPKKTGDVLKFSCYTKDALIKLKEIWNARHRDNKIISNDPKLIWGFLHTHMSNTCNLSLIHI